MIEIEITRPYYGRAVAYSHELDKQHYIEVAFYENGTNINTSSNTVTVTATIVCNGFLIAENVATEAVSATGVKGVKLDLGSNNNYTILPGRMLIEFKIVRSTEETYPVAPLVVKVTESIVDDAQVTPESYGTVGEILQEVATARGTYSNLNARLNAMTAQMTLINGAAMHKVLMNEGSAISLTEFNQTTLNGNTIYIANLAADFLYSGSSAQYAYIVQPNGNETLLTTASGKRYFKNNDIDLFFLLQVDTDDIARDAVTAQKIFAGSVNYNKLSTDVKAQYDTIPEKLKYTGTATAITRLGDFNSLTNAQELSLVTLAGPALNAFPISSNGVALVIKLSSVYYVHVLDVDRWFTVPVGADDSSTVTAIDTVADGAVTTPKIADNAVTRQKLSTELQTILGDYEQHDFLSVIDLGEQSSRTAFDAAQYVSNTVKYVFTVSGLMCSLFSVDSGTVGELVCVGSYQIVNFPSVNVRWIRKVNSVAPSFSADQWQRLNIEKSTNAANAWSAATDNALASVALVKAFLQNYAIERIAELEQRVSALEPSTSAPIYGVSGLYQSDPALTRTDDAVGLDFLINSSSGAIDSDFNDVFPWNETEIVNDAAGKFVKFPDMYFRVGADSSYRLTDVAVSKEPHSEGDWYKVDSFMYGCYGASVSNGTLKSVSGVARQGNTTRAQFRSYAAANGAGYYQLDLYHRTVLMFLWFIEFATKNSGSIMEGRISGSGTQGGSIKQPTGGTDSLGTPSGFETAYGQMRYHYIEDFIGNQQEFVDGVCCKGVGNYDYVTDDPANFSDDTTGKSPLAYAVPSNNWLTALGWDSNNPFMCMPAETNGGSDTTFFCDYSVSAGASYPVLYCGARFSDADVNYGLTYFCRNGAGSSNAYRGGRLLKSVSSST